MFAEPASSIIDRMSTPDERTGAVVRQLITRQNIEENFRWLFDKYYSAVYGFFYRKGFPPEDCRDLTQEVFVAVYMQVDKLRNDAAFVAWLFSISRHIAMRHLERLRKHPVVHAGADESATPLDAVAASDPSPLSEMLDQEKVEKVRQALAELPGRVRDCLRARVVDGLNYREIGQRLGISENTVAVHIHRGLKNLRGRLRPLFGEAPFEGDL